MSMEMKKRGLIFVILMIVLSFSAFGAGVTRTISKRTIAPSEVITVTIEINVDEGSTEVWAIDETFPNGWTITANPNGGFLDQAQHIKYLKYQPPIEDTTLTYSIQAPATTGAYTFNGIWMTNNDVNPQAIGGHNTVNVTTTPPAYQCSDFTDLTSCNAKSDCAWCDMYTGGGQCIDDADYECNAVGCNGETRYCHNCGWETCASGRVCETGDCVLVDDDTGDDGSSTTPSCVPMWTCTDYSACIDGFKTRTCTDSNNCGTNSGKPYETLRCRTTGDTTDTTTDDDSSTTTTTSRTRPTSGDSDTTTTTSRSRSDGTSSDESSTSSTSRSRPADDDEEDVVVDAPPPEKGAFDYIFYILLAITVLVGGGLLVYYLMNKQKRLPSTANIEQDNMFLQQSPGSANRPQGPAPPPPGKF